MAIRAFALCLVFAPVSVAVAADIGPPPTIEFWTIEANEGQSAGGHSGLRIGAYVYHVEHRGDGLIVDRRDPVEAFDRVYRLIGNRSIDVLELALPDVAAHEVEATLRERYFSRARRLEMLSDLEEDLDWLDRAIRRGWLEVFVPGLGLFAESSSSCESRGPGSEPARRLRGIAKNEGVRWLDDRIDSARQDLQGALARATGENSDSSTNADITPPNARSGVSGAEPDPVPAVSNANSLEEFQAGTTRGLVEASQRLLALEIVRNCRPVATQRLHDLPAPLSRSSGSTKSPVSAESVAIKTSEWTRIKKNLELNLRQLLSSHRPDVGLAILLTSARLSAIDITIDRAGSNRDRALVIDPFAEGENSDPKRALRIPEEWRAATLDEANTRLARELGRLKSRVDDPLESTFFRVEQARHSLAHAITGDVHHSAEPTEALRVTVANRYPGRTVPLPWPSKLTRERLRTHRRRVAQHAVAQRAQLENDLGYDLMTRNCVTELLSALDVALVKSPSTASFSSDRAKGWEAALAFIPVIAGRIAARNLPVSGRSRNRGWREEILENDPANGFSKFLLEMRESNTLTSRTYHQNDHDSAFLFFSQKPIILRPLAGAVNLATGLGYAGLGLLSAPFDRGTLMRRGLEGALMSIPELFFFNIRKGSNVMPPPGGSR